MHKLANTDPKAFENDAAARKLSRWLLEEELYKELRHYEKMFFNMPFIHSEVPRGSIEQNHPRHHQPRALCLADCNRPHVPAS